MIDVKEAATRKIGPLPAYAWGGIVGGGLLVYRVLRGPSGGSSSHVTPVGDDSGIDFDPSIGSGGGGASGGDSGDVAPTPTPTPTPIPGGGGFHPRPLPPTPFPRPTPTPIKPPSSTKGIHNGPIPVPLPVVKPPTIKPLPPTRKPVSTIVNVAKSTERKAVAKKKVTSKVPKIKTPPIPKVSKKVDIDAIGHAFGKTIVRVTPKPKKKAKAQHISTPATGYPKKALVPTTKKIGGGKYVA